MRQSEKKFTTMNLKSNHEKIFGQGHVNVSTDFIYSYL